MIRSFLQNIISALALGAMLYGLYWISRILIRAIWGLLIGTKDRVLFLVFTVLVVALGLIAPRYTLGLVKDVI